MGGSERLVRELFHDAEAELASVNGDASRSALHVIVIDEIDAVFRKRSSAEDSGEATRSSTVNQILSKLDGVQAQPNVLLIGMTNRRELLWALGFMCTHSVHYFITHASFPLINLTNLILFSKQ